MQRLIIKLKKWLITVKQYITWPYYWIVLEIQYRKRKKELEKQDPFIYE